MSMTSCNKLLALFGATNATVRFHKLGVLPNGTTLPMSFCVCERTSRPEPDTLSLLCHGLDSNQRYSYLCLSRLNAQMLALCSLGHKRKSTLVTLANAPLPASCCGGAATLSFRSSLLRSCQLLLCGPSLSLSFCCSCFCRSYTLFRSDSNGEFQQRCVSDVVPLSGTRIE